MREAIIFLQSWALWWPAAKTSCFLGARKIREGIAKSVSEIGDFLCIKSTVAIYEDTLEIAQWRKVKQLQSMWICMFGDFPCVKSTFAIYEDTLDIAQWRKLKRMQSMWVCMFGDFLCIKSTVAVQRAVTTGTIFGSASGKNIEFEFYSNLGTKLILSVLSKFQWFVQGWSW